MLVIIRERDGKTMPALFRTESEALDFIRNRIIPGTESMADESGNWNDLRGRYAIKWVNHQEAYSTAGGLHQRGEGIFQLDARR